MTMKNRKTLAAVAVLLALALVFVAPVSAEDATNESKIDSVEYATLAAAIAAAQEGNTVTLLKDVSSSEIIEIQKAITLDGDGYKLTSTATRAINVNSTGTVTIKNLTVATTTPEYAQSTAPERAVNIINKRVTLNLDNVTAEGFKYTINVAGSSIGSYINIISGKYGGYSALNVNGNDTVVVANNAVFHGNNTAQYDAEGWNTFAAIAINKPADNVSITINGGQIIATSTNGNRQFIASAAGVTNSVVVINSELEILNIDVFNAATINVAGTFQAKYATELAENGYVATIVNDELIAVYDTLAEAIAKGGNVKVLNDTTLAESITLTNSVSISADKPVTVTVGDTDSYSDNVINVPTNYALTLGKNITLSSAEDTIVKGTGGAIIIDGAKLTYSSTTKNSTLVVLNGGALTVNESSIIESLSGSVAISANTGSITINGGTISGAVKDKVTVVVKSGATATISGGKITSTNSSALYVEGSGSTATISGGEVATTCPDPKFSAAYSRSGGKIVMTGGTVSAAAGAGLVAVADGIVEVSGGTVNNGVIAHENANAKATISGGTINGDVSIECSRENCVAGTIIITGGTFSSNPSTYVASDYISEMSGSVWVVKKYVAPPSNTGGSSSGSSSSNSKPADTPVEPETPAEPEAGEATVETEVTDGGEVALETPSTGGSAAAADEEEAKVTGVVLPTGTEGKVTFIPISEQAAPAGKETQTKKVFEINIPNYEKGKAAVIKFQMTVAELEADGKTAAEVALWHFDEETGEWTKLVTSYVIIDGVVYFEAITNDFSPFAIVYEDAPVDEPQDEPETPATPAPLAAVLAGLGAAVVLRRK